MVLPVAFGTRWLREAVVERYTVAAGDPVLDPIEYPAPGFVFIETEPDEVIHVTPRLGNRECKRALDIASERVTSVGAIGGRVAQEGDEVARGSEADRGHHRILGNIGEFIDGALLERGSRR